MTMNTSMNTSMNMTMTTNMTMNMTMSMSSIMPMPIIRWRKSVLSLSAQPFLRA